MNISSCINLEQSIARKYRALKSVMDERSRRLWAAAEAREIGRGGASIVHKATGVDWKTISRGIRDLEKKEVADSSNEFTRIRQRGRGRKKLRLKDTTLVSDLDNLIEPTIRGDPMSGIRWTCKSTRNLAKEMNEKGHTASHTTIAQELRRQK